MIGLFLFELNILGSLFCVLPMGKGGYFLFRSCPLTNIIVLPFIRSVFSRYRTLHPILIELYFIDRLVGFWFIVLSALGVVVFHSKETSEAFASIDNDKRANRDKTSRRELLNGEKD